MERKILIKDENYDSKIETRDLYFRENAKEILFTGKNNQNGIREIVFLDLFVDDLLIERCETCNLKVLVCSFENEKDIAIKLRDVKGKSIRLEGRKGERLKINGENIRESVEFIGEIRDLVLTDFKNVLIVYENKNKRKTERLFCERGEFFKIIGGRVGGKKGVIKEIRFFNVKKVDLSELKLEKFNEFSVGRVEKLFTNIETVRNLKKGNYLFPKILFCTIHNEKDIEIVVEKYKQGLIRSDSVVFNEFGTDGEKNEISLKRLAEKTLPLSEVLKVRNIEVRRMILNYLGGVRKLLEKEENKVLMEKTDKGELWAVGNPKSLTECVKFLKYKDVSTEREYISFVPPDIESVRQGFAWKFQIREEEYDEILSES